MIDILKETIEQYKLRYGEAEREQRGYIEYIDYGGATGDILTIKEIIESHGDDEQNLPQFRKLKHMKKGEFVQIDGFYYGKNIVLIKKGWKEYLIDDMNKF